MKKIVSLAFVSMLLLPMLVATDFILQVRADSKTLYVDASNFVDPLEDGSIEHPFDRIQEAVTHARDGDTIFVKAGMYRGPIEIRKSIRLVGETKYDTIIRPMIHQTVWGLIGIYWTNKVTISGFTLRDHEDGMGIYIDGCRHCNITDNIIVNNEFGIDIRRSENIFVSNNTISRNSVYGTTISSNSINNILRNNNLTKNDMNLGIWGHFIHDIDSSNTVNGKPIYYLVNQKSKQIPEDAGYVGIVNSTNMIVRDLNLTNNGQGVLLAYVSNSTVENVNLQNNLAGLYLLHSHNNAIKGCTIIQNMEGIRMRLSDWNEITGNTISYYSDNGIFFENSERNTIVNNTISVDWQYSYSFWIHGRDNTIYHNNIIHHYKNILSAYVEWGKVVPNQWDNGMEGNYWSDYDGTDADEDDIGDTPYIIDEYNLDNYPLMKQWPWAPDTVPPTADAGNNQTVPVNAVVEFDASSSYDNVEIVSYEWDFGDGKIGTGATTNHNYTDIGNYTVTLIVRDAKDNNDSTSVIIEVLVDTDSDGIADRFDIDDDADGMPDEWEIENGLNPLDSSDKDQDTDGDWFSNIEEYRWGMNPRIYNPWKIYLTTAIVAMVITIPLTMMIVFILYRRKHVRNNDRI